MDPISSLFETQVRWFYCLRCQLAFELDETGHGACRCGRSLASLAGNEVEVRGPVKVLVPVEDIRHINGQELMFAPEDIVVRRVLPPAA